MVTVGQLSAAVRSRSQSAIEVTQAALAAAEADQLNAFTDVHHTEALERARRIDQQVGDGTALGPLAGVPIAVKDLIHHAGHVTTAGSSFYRHTAERSAPVLERMESAGAIVIGRTGLHEFAYGFNSENDWFGPVRNPYDPSLSPGGSSGGSGAAVGSGIVPLAIGTDTGGSVRVPAALCGAVGLKVTHGRIPISGVVPLAESLDTVGPIASSVDGAQLAFEVMAGDDPQDPWSAAVEDSPEDIALAGLRVGLPTQWLDEAPATREARDAFQQALDRLSDLDADIGELAAPTLAPDRLGWTLSAAEAAAYHRSWFTDPDKRYGPEIGARLAAAMEVTLDELIDARRWQAGLVGAARRVFRSVDVLATPTVGHPRKVIGRDTIDVNGVAQNHRHVLAYFTATVNQMWCPALTVPLRDSGAPPHSIQFIGPWWSERRLLALGRHLEATDLIGYERPSP